MMCDGHLIQTVTYDAENSGDSTAADLYVIDAKPDSDEDSVDGDVIELRIGGDKAPSISLDLDQSRAFIEACQEILNRYDA
jgi:hypothetical protein